MNDQWRDQSDRAGRDERDRRSEPRDEATFPGVVPPRNVGGNVGGSGGNGQGSEPGSNLQRVLTALIVVAAIATGIALWRDAMTSAMLFIFILIVLVVLHELGHFLTAKLFGVYVHEFGLGFPPKIWGKRFGETEYTINWLPIGGFVRLEGEENPENPRSLAAAARWKRFVILVSGGVVNLLLPIVFFSIALMIPHEVPEGRAVVSEVVPGSPAAVAGLQPDDVILSIDGRDARHMGEASRLIRLHLGDEVDFVVRRGGEEVTVQIRPRWSPPEGEGPTGILIAPQVVNPVDGRPYTVTESLAPWEAIPEGARQSWDTLILARNEVVSWFRGNSGPQFAGPVGIAQTTGEVARASDSTTTAIGSLLQLAALLSLNLGIINLLPLPMLDGGRVLFLLIEVARRGKRIAPEREALVHLVGFIAFITLALVITFMDISRIAAGESVFR